MTVELSNSYPLGPDAITEVAGFVETAFRPR